MRSASCIAFSLKISLVAHGLNCRAVGRRDHEWAYLMGRAGPHRKRCGRDFNVAARLVLSATIKS
jgi:hypothetical protein